MRANAETIRDIKDYILQSADEIESYCDRMQGEAAMILQDWNDNDAESFIMLISEVIRLTKSPCETLRATGPKLDNLAKAVDDYVSAGSFI